MERNVCCETGRAPRFFAVGTESKIVVREKEEEPIFIYGKCTSVDAAATTTQVGERNEASLF